VERARKILAENVKGVGTVEGPDGQTRLSPEEHRHTLVSAGLEA